MNLTSLCALAALALLPRTAGADVTPLPPKPVLLESFRSGENSIEFRIGGKPVAWSGPRQAAKVEPVRDTLSIESLIESLDKPERPPLWAGWSNPWTPSSRAQFKPVGAVNCMALPVRFMRSTSCTSRLLAFDGVTTTTP